MADSQNTRIAPEITTEAWEGPVDFYEQVRAAGVDQALIGKILDHVDTERAKSTAAAARLFYHSDDEPIPVVQFSGELSAMARRLCGLVAAASDLVEGHDHPCRGACCSSRKTPPAAWIAWPRRSKRNVRSRAGPGRRNHDHGRDKRLCGA